MIRVVCLFLLFLPLASLAQFTYFLDQTIPVQNSDGNIISLPWAGGLNAAAFNTMDLNGDDVDDLVLFDRMAGKVITFVNAANKYVPAPEFENLFPSEIANWLLLRDYNCDGKKDLFTGDVLGIKVYRNVTGTGANLQWEQHLFSTGFPGQKSNVLLTQGSNDKVNLQLQFDDLPAISDVDGDGDLDILNIQYAGHTVEFHQNMSAENNQPCDSLDFKRMTRSWGDFRECECGVFAFNGEACPPNSGGRTKHAGGKSLLAVDVTGDQQQDLIFSEAECNQLYVLRNAGTSLNPVINDFSGFPQTNPVNFSIFPAAFYEDVDFDGKKDLISTPNIFSKEFINTDLQHSTWLYKNTGSNASPVLSFVQRNFLQDEMIDVGDNAVPAFADFDGDDDFDLFISRSTSPNFASTIYLYENIGSPSSPAFKLVTEDYIGFSAARYYNLKIQFADINSDQTQDMVFTATSFDNNVTSLYYITNKSHNTLDFTGASLQTLDFSLTYSENAYITDVNADGLPDILAGRSEGNLEYWHNNGIQGSPSFDLEDENFLDFENSTLRQNLSCIVADLDGDGKRDLAVGDQTGKLAVISDFQNAEASASHLDANIVFNSLLEMYADKNLGGRIWPAAANLFNANKLTVAVGNVLGGIHILRHDEGKSLPEDPEINIYPNPVAKNEVLNVQADRHGTMQIVSVLGQQLSSPFVMKANEIYRYTLPPLASGLYLLKFTASKRSIAQRFIIK
jgi:hypothetical protein